MSTADKDVSAQVLRALAMLETLAGELPNGLANKELAAAMDVPASYVTRTADVLIAKGWVERTEAGRFRITSRFAQISVRSLRAFERAEQQLGDMKRNYLLG
jgi:DNA-binding IclR family transcriptional regulator